MKIEGIPEGWELVRIGEPHSTDFIVGMDGQPIAWHYMTKYANKNYVIIRRIPPPLSIPPKVFKDGWIFAFNLDRYYSEIKPQWVERNSQFDLSNGLFLNSKILPCIVFSDETPRRERICRVTWEHGSECDQT